MSISDESIVVIRLGQRQGDPSVISINCPDQPGLACDLACVLFEFGLNVVKGDMATILWELEVVIHRMKATTSPENRAVNIFYITDIRERFHEKRRQERLLDSVKVVLGESNASCKVMAAGPEWGGLECSLLPDLPPFTSNDIMEVEDGGAVESDGDRGSGHRRVSQNTSVILDNSLSPGHTLLQISCKDRRGLLYDCMRTLKDFQIQVAFCRLATNSEGCADVELFVLEADGSKIVDPERQRLLSCRLELEVVQPIKILTWNRGPDFELVVTAPVELGDRGRPKVLQDTTSVLRELDLGIFQADLQTRIIGDRKWEVYRFLITERPDFIPSMDAVRSHICEQTKKILVL